MARLHLRERFDRCNREPDNPSAQHPIHPRGYDSFHSCLWPALFEGYDPGVTGLPVEFRYPYLDIRMIRFLLSVPPVPWSRNKYLVRRSMRNHLPAEVLARPKTGLVAFPGFEEWKRKGLPDFLPTDLLETYVNVPVLKDLPIDSHHTFGLKLRPSIVSFFLRSLDLK